MIILSFFGMYSASSLSLMLSNLLNVVAIKIYDSVYLIAVVQVYM
jgi:hypothetical protein